MGSLAGWLKEEEEWAVGGSGRGCQGQGLDLDPCDEGDYVSITPSSHKVAGLRLPATKTSKQADNAER